MNDQMQKLRLRDRIRPYRQAIPEILIYQVVSKVLLTGLLFVLQKLAYLLFRSAGRAAVTSGDFLFMFTTWQGWVLLVIGFMALLLYTVLDLNAKILLSGNLLHGERKPFYRTILDSLRQIPRFLQPGGIWIILYVTLLTPMIGIGLSISLTSGLHIPTFITSFIQSKWWLNLLYSAGIIAFVLFGISRIFCMHGIILDDMPAGKAMAQSGRLFRENWKDFLKQHVLFVLRTVLAVIPAFLVVWGIPIIFFVVLSMVVPQLPERLVTLLIALIGALGTMTVSFLITPFYIMKSTQLYYYYKSGVSVQYPSEIQRRPWWYKILLVLIPVFVVGAALHMDRLFDTFFPQESKVEIIAHRAGGTLAPENTAAGIYAAYDAGADGSEIDIQRTKDDYYVVNHDATFARVAGVKKKPKEMTLEEVGQLSVGGEPVATLEDMLEASADRVTLFIELKGETADKRMAEDTVQMLREKGLEDQCVIISLKYDLISYIEDNYPDIMTGYLTFLSLGNTAGLNCDYLALEEESATGANIEAIHEQGKKVLVWTANNRDSQKHFLLSDADGLITDEVTQAVDLKEKIARRTDLERIMDVLLA